MSNNAMAIKGKVEMTLENIYSYKFFEVASAFIKKYENENQRYTTTTIAHVSQIDEDKF